MRQNRAKLMTCATASILLAVALSTPVTAQTLQPTALGPGAGLHATTVESVLPENRSSGTSILGKVTPSFSVAPRAAFRRRGPRGAMIDYAKQTVWLSTNVHDVLPLSAKPYWPSPVRLSVGRRGLGAGLPAEYVVGLDLDAAKLPGSHPLWMQVKGVLHTLRLPGPALVMGPSGTRALGLYW
ncbi:hypothetical protein [Gemmatimonas sp.]